MTSSFYNNREDLAHLISQHEALRATVADQARALAACRDENARLKRTLRVSRVARLGNGSGALTHGASRTPQGTRPYDERDLIISRLEAQVRTLQDALETYAGDAADRERRRRARRRKDARQRREDEGPLDLTVAWRPKKNVISKRTEMLAARAGRRRRAQEAEHAEIERKHRDRLLKEYAEEAKRAERAKARKRRTRQRNHAANVARISAELDAARLAHEFNANLQEEGKEQSSSSSSSLGSSISPRSRSRSRSPVHADKFLQIRANSSDDHGDPYTRIVGQLLAIATVSSPRTLFSQPVRSLAEVFTVAREKSESVDGNKNANFEELTATKEREFADVCRRLDITATKKQVSHIVAETRRCQEQHAFWDFTAFCKAMEPHHPGLARAVEAEDKKK